MLNQQLLNQIQSALNLEKISIIQTLTIVCYPKEQGPDFEEKLIVVKRELRKVAGQNIDIKIIKEGEATDVQSIEFC